MFVAAFVVFNANGREIGSYDSQPPKFTAIAIARYHTLALDTFVFQAPALAERPGFARDNQGHYRSAYPPLPGLIAGGVAIALRETRLLRPSAPAAAQIVAKLTASLLVGIAVALMFCTVATEIGSRRAAVVALSAAFGTNLWAQSSQTLWQSETALAGLALAIFLLNQDLAESKTWTLWLAAVGLAAVGAARAQLTPVVAILAVSIPVRRGRARDVLALTPLLATAAASIAANMHWFGSPLGARPQMEAAAVAAHAVTSPLGNPAGGAIGLLFSPNRGLFIFSPIAVVCLLGLTSLRHESWRGGRRWFALAAGVQFLVYASYSAWWGGHTFGPRLLMDLVPLLVPFASSAMAFIMARSLTKVAAAALLAWSVAVAATGAFVYPHDVWNSDPEVDVHHDRLWDWHDLQIVRAWKAGPSPQNFELFSRQAFSRRD